MEQLPPDIADKCVGAGGLRRTAPLRDTGSGPWRRSPCLQLRLSHVVTCALFAPAPAIASCSGSNQVDTQSMSSWMERASMRFAACL